MSSRPNEQSGGDRRPRWLHVGLLLGLTVLIYHRVLDFGFFPHWDDPLYLAERVEVANWFDASWRERLLTPEVGYPIPLPTFLYYWIGRLPADRVVASVHLVGLGFHLVNVALVYLLGARWLGRSDRAAAAAALWAAHPLLVESVAWATNLKTVTLGTFLLGSLWVWDRHVQCPDWRLAAGAVVLFLLALGCRPEAVIAAPLWAFVALWRGRESAPRRLVWGPIVLVAVVSALYVPLGVLGHDELIMSGAEQIEELTVADRLWRMATALGLQLRHTALPVDLHPSYSPHYAGAKWALGFGIFAAMALGAATMWAAKRRSSAVYGLSLFWAAYLPASGIAYLPRFTADTYMYLPLAGLALAVVAAAAHLASLLGRRVTRYGWLVVVSAVVFAGAFAYAQTLRWSNQLSLWEPTLEAQPNHPQAYWMVGAAYVSLERWEEAVEVYREGLPHFEQRQRIPFQMVQALREVGDEERAARVAATMPPYAGPGRRHAAGAFLELLASDAVRLRDVPELQDALDEVASERLASIASDSGRLDADVAASVAAEALEADRARSAAQLVDYALTDDPDHCGAWTVARTLDGPLRVVVVDGRAPPEECR